MQLFRNDVFGSKIFSELGVSTLQFIGVSPFLVLNLAMHSLPGLLFSLSKTLDLSEHAIDLMASEESFRLLSMNQAVIYLLSLFTFLYRSIVVALIPFFLCALLLNFVFMLLELLWNTLIWLPFLMVTLDLKFQ